MSAEVERVPGGEQIGPAVPGIGPIKGVLEFNGTIYAVRDDEQGVPRLWAFSGKGWVLQRPLLPAPEASSADRLVTGGIRESGEYTGVSG